MKTYVILTPGYLPEEIEADQIRIEDKKTILCKGRFDIVAVIPDDSTIYLKTKDECGNPINNDNNETN